MYVATYVAFIIPVIKPSASTALHDMIGYYLHDMIGYFHQIHLNLSHSSIPVAEVAKLYAQGDNQHICLGMIYNCCGTSSKRAVFY